MASYLYGFPYPAGLYVNRAGSNQAIARNFLLSIPCVIFVVSCSWWLVEILLGTSGTGSNSLKILYLETA